MSITKIIGTEAEPGNNQPESDQALTLLHTLTIYPNDVDYQVINKEGGATIIELIDGNEKLYGNVEISDNGKINLPDILAYTAKELKVIIEIKSTKGDNEKIELLISTRLPQENTIDNANVSPSNVPDHLTPAGQIRGQIQQNNRRRNVA